MTEENSILDKVMDSHKAQEKEQFYPSELVSSLLKCLSSKEEDILRRRFGLNRDKLETLEEIGKNYNVTRERIRQIENNSVTKIRATKNFDQQLQPVKHILTTTLQDNGGFVNEEILLESLIGYSDQKKIESRAIIFILKVLLKTEFQYLDNNFFRPTWGLKHASLDLLKKVIEKYQEIFQETEKPLASQELIDKFKQTELYQNNQEQLSDQALDSYLYIGKKIGYNPYQEFGLVKWGAIRPKRINDKIYLVLRKNGKPMHFTKIAEKINQMKFDRRKAYPPTIHNELIMNKKYVLVGRGIYALKEWGYKPGVVADVLEEILKKSDKPLSRKELVAKVLEQRMVKKNTIHLALTDKKRFKKNSESLYVLVEDGQK